MANGLELNLSAQVERIEVAASSGLQPLRSVSAKLDAESRELDLEALDMYLQPAEARARGPGQFRVSASVSAGQVDVGSQAVLQLQGSALSTSRGSLSGDLTASVRALPTGILEWVTSSPLVHLQNGSDHKDPALGSPTLRVQLTALDLLAPTALERVELEVPSLIIPSLGWSNSLLRASRTAIELGGRVDGQVSVAWQAPDGWDTRVKLRLLGGTLESQTFHAKLAGHVDMATEPNRASKTSVGRVDIDLDGVEVVTGTKRTAPFRASVRATDVRVVTHPSPQLSGQLQVKATPADSLLSLWIESSLLKGLAASVLELERLDADAEFRIGKGAAQVELSRATSGALNGKGYWQRPAQGESRGAFLITTKVANAGLTVTGSDTETSLFVADDWLPRGWAAARRKAQRTSLGHGP